MWELLVLIDFGISLQVKCVFFIISSTGRHCASLGLPNCQAVVALQDFINHAESAHGIPCISVDLNQEFYIEQITRPGNFQMLRKVDWKPVFIFVKTTSNIFRLRTIFDSAFDGEGRIRWTIQDSSSSGGDHIAMISFVNGPLEVGQS